MAKLFVKKNIFLQSLVIIFVIFGTAAFTASSNSKQKTPICKNEPNFASPSNGIMRSLKIRNSTNSNLNINWLNNVGDRVLYKVLRPGELYKQEVYEKHYWLASRAGANGKCLAIKKINTLWKTDYWRITNPKNSRPNYAERCNIAAIGLSSVDNIKESQRRLKKLGLYTSTIDGIFGKGTERAFKAAKAMLGNKASAGECFNKADIDAFLLIEQELLTTNSNAASFDCTKAATETEIAICGDKSLSILDGDMGVWWRGQNKTSEIINTQKQWLLARDKCLGSTKCIKGTYLERLEQIAIDVRCNISNLEVCSDIDLCTRATNLSNGLRRWKGLESLFVERAKSTGLDCGITVDSTPLTQQEAIYFLSQLTDFVSDNSNNFDLDFASEFNKVRPITQGNWSSNLSEVFENFRAYSLKLESFQQYIEDVRLTEETRDKNRIEELRAGISQDLIILKKWGKANVLDEKAAQISVLVTQFGNKDLQTINELEQTAKQSQNLLAATGIKDGPTQAQTQDIVDSLYNPSSIYVFANVTGDAENLYKNLDGIFDFERTTGTHCSSDKFTAFDQYIFTKKFFENFKDLTTLKARCSPSSDIYVAKGNELTSDRLFNQVNLSGLELIFEMSKDQRDAEFDQLAFLKTAIKNDVMDGIRIGFGLLRADTSSQKSCGIINDQDQGHIAQLDSNRMLLIALGYEQGSWEGFDKTTQSDEEAFKMLQRGQCGFIYGSELTLARLYLASERAKIKLEFMPIWIIPTAVESSQRLYDAEKTAETEANSKVEKSLEAQVLLDEQKAELEKQKLEDQLLLEQQALKSAGEVAAVRQRAMREQNGLKFSVLKDKLQDLLFIAVQFGLENSVEEGSYESKYLEQPFVDPILSNSFFDGVITDMQILASERWEVTEQKLNQIDFGQAIFKGRELDALVVELQISSKNRIIGDYQEYCRRVHIIFDDDFEMWRSPEIGECDQSISKTDWYNSWQFQSKWIAQP